MVCCALQPEHGLNATAPLSIIIKTLKSSVFSAAASHAKVVGSVGSAGPYQSITTPLIPRLTISFSCLLTCVGSHETYPTFMWRLSPNQGCNSAYICVLAPVYNKE